MTKGAKIGIIVGVVIILGVGGYFLYRKLTSDGTDSNDDSVDDQKPQDESQVQPVSSGVSLEPTPFKNQGQGDYFRLWVNRYYSSDAKALDLDKQGKFDNDTIRKAFMKYGVLYKQQVKNWNKIQSAVPKSFADKFDKKDSYNFQITSTGQIVLLPKVKFANEGINFNSNGKWYQGKDGKNSGNWWASGTQANFKGKNYKADNFFALSKLLDKAITDNPSNFSSFTYRNNLDLENNFVD